MTEQLTQREKDAAILAAAGRSNKEIAETLRLSRGTVEQYLNRAYQKLDVRNRGQLMYKAESLK
jgi:RNA polymerase sigma factor (sigma-70 family)